MTLYRKAWEIVGYTYEADIHCPECADSRFHGWQRVGTPIDCEGNPIHPVFVSDDYAGLVCGDCSSFIV